MKGLVPRLAAWVMIHHRWIALGAVFSLFSLFALFTGDEAWLGFLGFLGCLGFLAPMYAQHTPETTA